MKFLTIALLTLSVFSNEIDFLKKSKKDKHIIIQSQEALSSQEKLYIYQDQKLKAIAQTTRCVKLKCIVQITKNSKSFSLDAPMHISQNKIKKVKVVKTTKTYKNSKKPTKSKDTWDKYLAFSYGGAPFSQGLRFSYGKKLNEKMLYHINYSMISSEIGNVDTSGWALDAGVDYHIYKHEHFDAYLTGNLGYTSADIDFAKIATSQAQSNAQTSTSGVYFSGGVKAQKLFMNDTLGLHLGLGYGLNLLDDVYNIGGVDYNLGFAGGNFIIDLGVSYHF